MDVIAHVTAVKPQIRKVQMDSKEFVQIAGECIKSLPIADKRRLVKNLESGVTILRGGIHFPLSHNAGDVAILASNRKPPNSFSKSVSSRRQVRIEKMKSVNLDIENVLRNISEKSLTKIISNCMKR